MEATDDIDKHNISRPDISAPKVIVNNVELDGTGNPQIFRQRMNMWESLSPISACSSPRWSASGTLSPIEPLYSSNPASPISDTSDSDRPHLSFSFDMDSSEVGIINDI